MTEESKRRLRERFEQLLANVPTGDPRYQPTITEIEERILSLRDQVAQAALEEISREAEERERAPESEPETPSKQCCPGCGRANAWYKGNRSRQIVTRIGEMRLMRRYYYCRRCDQGFCPLDRRLGLPAGTPFTTGVQQEVALLSACLPFEQATQALKRLTGISVSARSAERLCVERAGAIAATFGEQSEEAALPLAFLPPSELPARCPDMPKPEVLYLAADGIQTPMQGGSWREMKIGVARSLFKDGRVDQESRYVQHLGDSERFGERFEALAISSGSLLAARVVILGDGAAWLWKLATNRFPRAVQILDFWHALEYAGKVAREAFGEGTEAAKEWLSARALEMKQSQMEKVTAALKAVRSEAGEAVDEALRYYANNVSRMDYARYVKEGLSIGSGVAESACKRLVTERLKGSGMRWTEIGAAAVCALRCLLLGNQWDQFLCFWNQKQSGGLIGALSPQS